MMVFVETLIFTKMIGEYLEDSEYRKLQNYLMETPSVGDIIIGTGGLRKIRWASNGKGKRGGIRIIYFWQKSEEQIYLLTVYAKNEMSDLTSQELKMLKQTVDRW